MNKNKLFIVGVFGSIAVALGAIGAHFLKSKIASGLISLDQLSGFDTAVKYQMYHTLAMLLVLVVNHQHPNKYFNWAYNLFLIGIILFSGSLYFLCTRNLLGAGWLTFLGPITPIGGVFFICGWICLCLPMLKRDK